MTDAAVVIDIVNTYNTNEVFCYCTRFSESDVSPFMLTIQHYICTYSVHSAVLRYRIFSSLVMPCPYITGITHSVVTRYYWVHTALVWYSYVTCITQMYRRGAIRGATAWHRFNRKV